MKIIVAAIIAFVTLSAFSCSMPTSLPSLDKCKASDEASCVAISGCHWNKKESACKG